MGDASANVLAKGMNVWIPNPADKDPKAAPFLAAQVVSPVSGTQARVALRNGTEVSVDVDKVDVANTVTVVTDADERSEPDNCSLLHLSEATLLHNTQLRFQRDEIYTLTGQIVTSLNPCKQLPALYDAAAMAATRAELNPGAGETKRDPTPHIFTVAEAAYSSMVEQKRNQSIVVSGVSGAGKTEANKYVMRYLCWRASGGGGRQSQGENDLVKAILHSNPVFEAFGNATTINNPNSSRFGKFIKIYFDGGAVAGATLSTYLLEKSRVVAQQPSERSFHIFYQVRARARLRARARPRARPAPPRRPRERPRPPRSRPQLLSGSAEELGPLQLTSTSSPRYVKGKGGDGGVKAFGVGALDDAADWAVTRAAIEELGLGAGGELLKLLGGLLHLGDVSFVKLRTSEGGVSDEGCNIAPEAAAALANAEGLLGVAGLARTLTVRIVRAGGGRSSVYKVPLDVAKAEATRDALAKRIYERVPRNSARARAIRRNSARVCATL